MKSACVMVLMMVVMMKEVVVLVVIKVKMMATDHFFILNLITSSDVHFHTTLFIVKAASVISGRLKNQHRLAASSPQQQEVLQHLQPWSTSGPLSHLLVSRGEAAHGRRKRRSPKGYMAQFGVSGSLPR